MLEVISLATQRAVQNLYPNISPQELTLPSKCKETSRFAFAALLGGIAGFDRPSVGPIIESAVSKLFNIPIGPQLRLTNDVDLLACTMPKTSQSKAAVVLIAGTGSIAMSYSLQHALPVRIGRSGGWGHVIGDDGSGFDIGRQGLRAVLSALDEARSTSQSQEIEVKAKLSPFHIKIMNALQAPDNSDGSFDLLSHILTQSSPGSPDLKTRIASLAPIVLEAASSDPSAAAMVSKAAGCLVGTLRPLLKASEEYVLILAGGLMRNQRYRELVLKKLEEDGIRFAAVEYIRDAAVAGLESMIAARK